MKKLYTLLTALLLCTFVWGDAVPSGELYATYQKHGDRFYKGGGEADLSADYFDWAVNYYIVTCGDSILLRATTTEDGNLSSDWQTQARVWNGTYNNQQNEIQTNAGDSKNRYTSVCRRISTSVCDVKMHFFLSWEGNCTTQTFDFNRTSINNPIEDNVAPIIDPTEVTMEEVGTKLVFTFGDVTTDDPYFYYVGDKDHNLGGISLNNKVYITKPTIQDGLTYTFKCYAVDYNGNKSEGREFTLVMPFSSETNLALNKPCTGGYCQFNNSTEEGRAGEYRKANDGDASTSYSAYGAPSTDDAWWQVNLGAAYDITSIKVNWNSDYSTGYAIYGSLDGTNWLQIGQDAATAAGEKTTSLNASTQYVKIHSYNKKSIVIKEVEVYGSGLSVPDATNPEVTVTEVSSTINTVTLQIDATDEDDAGNAGTITAINISGDNDFVTLNNIALDESNQYTITGLTYNTTYTFTVHVFDLAGNEATQDIEVVLPFNTDYNIAEGKNAVAGKTQGDNVANKGCDGNLSTMWSSYTSPDQTKDYWYVDLEALYAVRQIKIKWMNDYSKHFIIQGVKTLPEEENREDDSYWTTYLDYTYPSDPGNEIQTHDVVGNMRYLRFKSLQNEQAAGVEFYELEVYASGFAVEDNVAPVIETASCTTNTETATVTFTLAASDAVDGTISDFYISCADPVVAGAKYTADGENHISISGLNVDEDYYFLVRCRDLSGNWASTNLVAHFSMASGTNVALGKTATAGRDEGGNTPDKAVDNSTTTRWGNYKNGGITADENWWQVDLTNAYKIEQIAILWEHFPNGGIILEASLDGSIYDEIATASVQSEAETITITGVAAETPYRFVRIKASNNTEFMSFYDFAVYASEELVFVTLGEATNNSTLITGHDDDQAIVTLNRSFEANTGNYTLVLPFDMTAEQCEAAFGASYQLWYLSDSYIKSNGDIYLNFVSASSIVAGRPYLFCPAANVASGAVISDVHIDATPAPSVTAQASFVGTYDVIPQATISTTSNAYLLGGDNWLYEAQHSSWDLKALRAYFTLNFTPVNGVAPRIRVVYNESGAGVSTDLNPVTGNPSPVTQKILRNGQLIIIRNGVEYNAQGQIIK